ncbi:MAG TPA: hypothetical protein V6D50_09785 [Chroococcales cyanobacterium]
MKRTNKGEQRVPLSPDRSICIFALMKMPLKCDRHFPIKEIAIANYISLPILQISLC